MINGSLVPSAFCSLDTYYLSMSVKQAVPSDFLNTKCKHCNWFHVWNGTTDGHASSFWIIRKARQMYQWNVEAKLVNVKVLVWMWHFYDA